MRKIFLLYCLTMLCSGPASAQFMDTIRTALDQRTRFVFKFDTRNSFIANRRAEVFGIKLGVDFGRKFRIGGGLHSLKTDLTKNIYLPGADGTRDTIISHLKLNYMAYFVEYVFHRTKKWEFSIPVQLGFGNTRFEYQYLGTNFVNNRRMVILYEPGISGQYKIFKWFGLGADFGYRVLLKRNKAIRENLTSPVYGFRVLIFYGQLYKAIFPNTKLAKKIE